MKLNKLMYSLQTRSFKTIIAIFRCSKSETGGNFQETKKNFFVTRCYKAATAEETWAYHTAKHQQLFHSNDCILQLFKTVFPDSDVAKTFAFARTKIASIITSVLAPYAQKSCYLTFVPSLFYSRLMPLITAK